MLGAVDMLADMPATLAGLGDRWLSWSQTSRRSAGRPARCRCGCGASWTGWSPGAMVAHRDWEPDAIVQDVWDWVDARQPSRLEKAEAAAAA